MLRNKRNVIMIISYLVLIARLKTMRTNNENASTGRYRIKFQKFSPVNEKNPAPLRRIKTFFHHFSGEEWQKAMFFF